MGQIILYSNDFFSLPVGVLLLADDTHQHDSDQFSPSSYSSVGHNGNAFSSYLLSQGEEKTNPPFLRAEPRHLSLNRDKNFIFNSLRSNSVNKNSPLLKENLNISQNSKNKIVAENESESEWDGGFTRILSGFLGNSFLDKLDLAIWKHGLKDRNQLLALHSLLAGEVGPESRYANAYPHGREGEVLLTNALTKKPQHTFQEEESSVLMVDNVLPEKSEEIRDIALKKWLNFTESPSANGTVEQLSYKVIF